MAQYDLGEMYRIGQGVPQDYKEAVKWYTKAAEQGIAFAQYILGVSYSEGIGVPKDDKEAVKWYTKAAEQGHASALLNLGIMYDFGRGVLKDYVTAYGLYNLSAYFGAEEGSKNRNSIAKEMTPEQIAKAQELSKQMLKEIEARKAQKKK